MHSIALSSVQIDVVMCMCSDWLTWHSLLSLCSLPGSSVNRTGHTTLLCSPSQEEAFHKPVKLAPVRRQDTLDTDREPELRQTLLSNGHTPRASQSDSTPLRSASD